MSIRDGVWLHFIKSEFSSEYTYHMWFVSNPLLNFLGSLYGAKMNGGKKMTPAEKKQFIYSTVYFTQHSKETAFKGYFSQKL